MTRTLTRPKAWLFSLLALALIAGPTAASAAPNGRVMACLKAAKSKISGGTVHAVGRDGSSMVYHVTRGSQQALVFLPASGTTKCIVKGIGHAAARVWGQFVAGKSKLKAYLLPAECKTGDCPPSVLAVRDAKKRVIAATRLHEDYTCTQGGKLQTVTLFSKKTQTLALHCRSGTGGFDYTEAALLYQVRGNRLQLLLAVPLGTGVTWPDGNLMCQAWPPGWVKPIQVGRVPTLRALELESQDGVGRVEALQTTYRYDIGQGKFVRTSAVKTQVNIARKCKPRRP